ncbi:MAG: type II secretion system F family protein [Gammaproteobacteria bacterium]
MKKPGLKDMQLFARQMQAMLKAHVPLNKAIELIADSTANQMLKTALYDVVHDIESGYPLAKAFNKHPTIFSSILRSMTDIGEQTGKMTQAFVHIIHYYDFEIQTRKRLKQVSRYPGLLLIAIGVAMAIINILIVPRFSVFFEQFGADLPWATQILIGSSDLIMNEWPWLIAAVVAAVSLFKYWLNHETGRMKWDRNILRIPIIGSIIERTHLARFCQSLGLALQAGVPLNEALTLVARAIQNAHFSEKIQVVRQILERGEPFSQAMAHSTLFSGLVLQMVMVGEETADLPEMLYQCAAFYEDELEYDVKRLGDSLEPILVGIVAFFVLILALGVFLPMWDMSNVALTKISAE